MMKKLTITTCVLAILATASTATSAKDFKQDAKASSLGTVMSDAEMDGVSAGSGFGFGLTTAETNNASPPAANLLPAPGTDFGPGYGQSTAVSTGNYPFH